jgi:hypothetical protein
MQQVTRNKPVTVDKKKDKPRSQQRMVGLRARYARKYRAEGRCTQCAAPTHGHSYCEECRQRDLDIRAARRRGARWTKGKRGRPPKQPNDQAQRPPT